MAEHGLSGFGQSSYSFDPAVLPGNVEQFTGVAQVPIGIAGPLLVDGEHAQGEFYVPLATAEGTLVASYNRGMKLLYEAGGVTVTVVVEPDGGPLWRLGGAARHEVGEVGHEQSAFRTRLPGQRARAAGGGAAPALQEPVAARRDPARYRRPGRRCRARSRSRR